MGDGFSAGAWFGRDERTRLERCEMAQKADAKQRIELQLRSVRDEVEEISVVAEEWEELDETERMSISLEWGNAMAKFDRLAEMDIARQLTGEQRGLLIQLSEEITARDADIRRLGFRLPKKVPVA